MNGQVRGFLLLCFGLCATVAMAQGGWREKIAPEVQADLATHSSAEAIIVFHVQADVRGAHAIRGKEAKARFVFEQTEAAAQRSQGTVRHLLRNAKAPFRTFRIVNAIAARVTPELARRIAARPEVRQLQPNPWAELQAPTPDHTPVSGGRNVIEWGVERINADDVWAMGIRGEGVVVGGQDTGVEWTHPTIIDQYRGIYFGNVDHNYNWHDAIHELNPLNNDTITDPSTNPCGLDVEAPCDDNNHGTYTVGIMVGDDGQGNQIGAAPAASWMACRNMDRGWGSPASYIECFDFFLAPTDLQDENPNPELAPHVINNSWGCPPIEGCNPDNFALMEQAVEALRAAGVVVVVSAGNSGANCGSVDDPAAIFEGSFAVGATRQNDTIANFSSRGAVEVDGSMRLKPNIAAPGVGIRSARRNAGFMTANGTSAAGPFVAAVVALVIDANPDLAGEVDTIEHILEVTARPMLSEQDCGPFPGSEVPNAVYGYGILDALAAVQLAQTIVITDTESPSATANLKVFPNPASEQVYLSGWDAQEEGAWRLFSADGRLVRQAAITDALTTIPLQGLPAGMYWYQVTGKNVRQNGRLVIQP